MWSDFIFPDGSQVVEEWAVFFEVAIDLMI